MADSFKLLCSKQEIPDTPEGRVGDLKKLPLAMKLNLIPTYGETFRIGPLIFKVTFANPGQLRFTSELYDIIIDGVNDGVSDIIDPHTGKEIVKQ